MQLSIMHPNCKTFLAACALFGAQFALFFAGEHLLFYRSMTIFLQLNDEAWNFVWPPYSFIELGIFLTATFSVALFYSLYMHVRHIPVRYGKLGLCLCTEILLFGVVSIISSTSGPCVKLLSVPLIYLPWPTCGTSSVNPTNLWFMLFALLTITTWSSIFSPAQRSLLRISIES